MFRDRGDLKEKIRSARACLGITQQELSDASMVDKKGIARFETGQSVPHDRTLRDLRRTLEERGVEFLFDGNVGVELRVKSKSGPPSE